MSRSRRASQFGSSPQIIVGLNLSSESLTLIAEMLEALFDAIEDAPTSDISDSDFEPEIEFDPRWRIQT